MEATARRQLRAVFDHALAAVHGETAVYRHLRSRPLAGPVDVLAVGKAAGAMFDGAVAGCDARRGLVVTKPGHGRPRRSPAEAVEVLESAHPVPDRRSLAAGEALLAFIGGLPRGRPLLILVSGGASSLVEVPAAGVDLDLLVRANRWLLGSGLDIGAVNAVRRRLSRIKGGGLPGLLGDRPARGLLISDVPGDDPSVIGSGLLAPGAGALPGVPDWLAARLPGPSAVRGGGIDLAVVASNARARSAAAERARETGWPVHARGALVEGDARQAARALVAEAAGGPPGLYLRGGETTVTLPAAPGEGGRNQHFALAAADAIRGRDDLLVLAAGTDGSDGPTAWAGGLVDGGTVERGEAAGLDARQALAAADSGRFLDASGDRFATGPTGTNVMDLYLVFKSA